jgi:hypothetical protein
MYYYYETSMGTFYIVPREDRWHVVYEDESLGSYHSPRAAADDLSGGHTFSPSNGVKPGELGIPEDINEWSVSR